MKTREPIISDSPALYSLVERCKPLDLNSRYAYMLIASHFRSTSIVAEEDGRIVGLISGYRIPETPNILFVWQVAVAAHMRGRGVAIHLLTDLLKRPSLADIEFIDTTVTPSNTASDRLFHRLGALLGTRVEIQTCFTGEHFGGDDHEEELLYRIGPLQITIS